MMKSRFLAIRFLAAMILFALFVSPIKAQKTRELTQEDDKKTAQKRVALVIGNGAYTKAKPLANPSNDAADMAATLKDLGFEVISGVNQNKRQMETLIREFGMKLAASGGVGLFYYAGHGLQVGGENFLVPVDADIPEEDEVSYSAVSINLVLSKMATAKNDLNIIILDACRNNPFARSWRSFRDNSNSDGLAKISPPTGTLVLYATEPGKVASDGTGRNGLFTEALLKQIRQPNLEYDQLVKAISADVWQKSNKQQLPWKEGNSLQDFYFVGNSSSQAVTKSKPLNVPEPKIVAKSKAEQEKESWDLVKNSTNPTDFRAFLKEFPTGANASKAKLRLEELVWESAKNSNDKTEVQAYLKEFPNGANASAARIKLRQLETAKTQTTPVKPSPNQYFDGESFSWKSAKDGNMTDLLRYILQFPKGRNINEAKERVLKEAGVMSSNDTIQTNQSASLLSGIWKVSIKPNLTGTWTDFVFIVLEQSSERIYGAALISNDSFETKSVPVKVTLSENKILLNFPNKNRSDSYSYTFEGMKEDKEIKGKYSFTINGSSNDYAQGDFYMEKHPNN